MRILIEEYQYNVADIKSILYGIDALENVEGKVSVQAAREQYGVVIVSDGIHYQIDEQATASLR